MLKICACGCGRPLPRTTQSDLSERKFASNTCRIRYERERRTRLARQRRTIFPDHDTDNGR